MGKSLADLSESELDTALDGILEPAEMRVTFSERQLIHDLRVIAQLGDKESNLLVAELRTGARMIATALSPGAAA